MSDLKLAEIIDNYINGNIDDFKKQVATLSKHDFLQLILIMQVDYDCSKLLKFI